MRLWISASGKITRWRRKWELSFLQTAHLLVILFIPTKYQIISNSMEVMACTILRFMGDNYMRKKEGVVSLPWTCLLVLLSIPTKCYQIISHSMGVMASQDFGFRGNNYIMKKVLHVIRLLVLCFIPTKFYQHMSKVIKDTEHKRMRLQISAAGEITT